MARLEIDFEWPVAKRYEIIPGGPAKGNTILTGGVIEPMLKAIGPETLKRPLDWDIYLWVADMRPTIDSYAKFASEYGLLGGAFDNKRSSSLMTWRETINDLKTLRSWSQDGQERGLFDRVGSKTLRIGSQADVVIKQRPDGLPVLAFRPASLRAALMLQCAQKVLSGAAIRACIQCGRWFTTGGSGGKRADARFCSKACKVKHMNDRARARAKGEK